MLNDLYQEGTNLVCSYFRDSGYYTFTQPLTESELFNWNQVSKDTNRNEKLNWNGKSVTRSKDSKLTDFRLLEIIYENQELYETVFSHSQVTPNFLLVNETDNLVDTIIVTSGKNTILIFTTEFLDDSIIDNLQSKINSTFNCEFELKYKLYDNGNLLLESLYHNIYNRFNCYLTFGSYSLSKAHESMFRKLNVNKTIFDYIDIIISHDKSQKEFKDDLTPSLMVLNSFGIKKDRNTIGGSISENLYNTVFDCASLLYYENEKQIFSVVTNKTSISGCPLKNGMQSTKISEYIMYHSMLAKNLVYAKPKKKQESFTYVGGMTVEPKEGFFENVVYLDYGSMYLTIMRAFNISPDTYVGVNKELDIEKTLEKRKDVTITANKTVYRKTGGLIRNKLDELSELRDIQKDKIKKYNHVLNLIDSELKSR